MRRYRLVIAAGAACVAVAALAACGDDDGGGSGDQVGVTVVLPSLQNEAYLRVKEGVEQAADENPDADVTIESGTNIEDANELIAKIDSAITQGADAIAVDAGAVPDQLTPTLKKAIDQGIPVIALDVEIPDLEGQTSYIGLDNEPSATPAGEYVSEQLPDGGDVGIVACVAGHPITDARIAGFEEGLADNVKVVTTLDAKCDAAQARSVTEDMLTAHPQLDAIFSTSDSQLTGVLEALRAAKADPVVIGYDGQQLALDAIAAGDILDATIENPFEEQGFEATEAAIAAAQGEEVEERIVVKTTLITSDNVAEIQEKVKAATAGQKLDQ